MQKIARYFTKLRIFGCQVQCLGLLLCLFVSSCGQPADSESIAVDTKPGKDELAGDVMQKWSKSCALCHVTGVAGAPKIGETDVWRPRLAQGKATLLKHTIEGYNNMPPLGYCMSCEEEDFVALIDLMLGGTK